MAEPQVKRQKTTNQNRGTFTITFGDVIENHTGMEQIGTKCKGYTYDELVSLHDNFSNQTRLIRLEELLPDNGGESEKACVLLWPDFLNQHEVDPSDLFQELVDLPFDKKYFCSRRKKVLNKRARWNLCFDDVSRDPDYDNKKGRIIAFGDVPLTKKVKDTISNLFGEKSQKLKCELNYYYDSKKTGIGFHGDTERNIVIGVRVGEPIPLVYAWFFNSMPISKTLTLNLKPGDLYIMSQKALGCDWRKVSQKTLRHAAGADKFTKLNRGKYV